jgi:hypothetical protein
MKDEPAHVERLWQAARYLPQSVRLLGTRYRSLFVAHAHQTKPTGNLAPVADALAFVDFMLRQSRVALLENERRALRADDRALRRRFRLTRRPGEVAAFEKWKIRQWLRL